MSEKKISKNVCPHCGSKNVTVDVDVRIGCHIEDGQIMLNDEYLDRSGESLQEPYQNPAGKIMADSVEIVGTISI